jgi:hypothetical protein
MTDGGWYAQLIDKETTAFLRTYAQERPGPRRPGSSASRASSSSRLSAVSYADAFFTTGVPSPLTTTVHSGWNSSEQFRRTLHPRSPYITDFISTPMQQQVLSRSASSTSLSSRRRRSRLLD